MNRRRILAVVAAAVALSALGVAPAAWASTTSGLAVDSFLHSVMASFVGAVAYTSVIVGIVVAGARLVSGGDLHGFLRTMVMLTIIAGLTISGQAVINMMSANSAVVAEPGAASGLLASSPTANGSTC